MLTGCWSKGDSKRRCREKFTPVRRVPRTGATFWISSDRWRIASLFVRADFPPRQPVTVKRVGAGSLFRRPDLPRPFRVPLYPDLPLAFISASSWIAIHTLVERPLESCLGIATVDNVSNDRHFYSGVDKKTGLTTTRSLCQRPLGFSWNTFARLIRLSAKRSAISALSAEKSKC